MSESTTKEEPEGTKPVRVSASQLDTFEKCSLKCKFNYIDKVERVSSLAAVRGTFVHSVLEGLYELDSEERDLDTTKLIARAEWDLLVENNEEFQSLELEDQAQREFRQESWKLIRRLWEIESPKSVEVDSNEMKLEFDIEEGVHFIGYADRLDRVGDGIEVIDYKTGKRPANRFAGDKKRQIKLYALAVDEMTGKPVRKGKLLFFGGTTPGIITVKINESIIQETKVELITDARKIKKAKNGDLSEIKATPHTLCGWCDFFAHCQEGQEYITKRVKDGDFRRLDAPGVVYLGLP